jgi:protein-S-isoprenylcysteine O-methyltransferase Ste14
METARYVFGVLLVIGLPPGMLWWFLVHPFVGFWRRVGAVETIIIMAAVGILGAVGLLAIRDTLLLADYGTQPVLVALAAALATTSVWIAVKRRKHLTTSILVGMPELEEGGHGGRLLSEGIYSRVRHPRYVEIVLGCLAYALFANYLGAYIVAVLCIPVVHLIVLLEERELIDRFGDEYVVYAERVPRYIPRRG